MATKARYKYKYSPFMFYSPGQDEVVVFSEASEQLDECYAHGAAIAQQLMVLGTV